MAENMAENDVNTRKISSKTSTKKTLTRTTAQGREFRRQQAVHMRAMGHAQPEIASTLRVSARTVRVDLAQPKSKEELAALRDKARTTMLEHTANGLVDGATALVRKTLDDKDAKSFDAASRGLLNLEKVSSSASGEARKIEVADTTPKPTPQDLRDIINKIVGYDIDEYARSLGFRDHAEYEDALAPVRSQWEQSRRSALKARK
jgi:hypothetical protein